MKHKIEITLPTIPYDHSVKDVIAYIQAVVSELTGTQAEIVINDFDYTDIGKAYKDIRQPSYPKRSL